jgi:hypothetical protein
MKKPNFTSLVLSTEVESKTNEQFETGDGGHLTTISLTIRNCNRKKREVL